jgi:hypothetical protein
MTAAVRRLARDVVVGRSLIATAVLVSSPAAAQSCHAAYISHCVLPVRKVGDLDCNFFYAQSISHI